MTKSLKQILFTIARLPSSDQRWIVHRLSTHERNALNRHRGLTLLQEAQRFRTLNAGDACLPMNPQEDPLPSHCNVLAQKSPLYVAIVLAESAYPWAKAFLKHADGNGLIQSLMDNQVLDIKPVVRQAVLFEWERIETTACFEDFLDG